MLVNNSPNALVCGKYELLDISVIIESVYIAIWNNSLSY